MTCLPLGVANWFITQSEHISHLKLQKLTYCAYGWHLVQFGIENRLFNESPQAWDWGPVFASMYKPLRVQEFSNRLSPSPFYSEPIEVNGQIPTISDLSKKQKKLLDFVYKRYETYTGKHLVALTHRPNTAWYKVAEKHSFDIPKNGIELSDSDIYFDFSSYKDQ